MIRIGLALAMLLASTKWLALKLAFRKSTSTFGDDSGR